MDGWELLFYETASGRAPVEEFLDALAPVDAARAAEELRLLQRLGVRLDMPHARAVSGTELWELRIRGRLQHRVFYVAVTGRQLLLLHAFTKKSEKTPPREIRTALQRLADFRERAR